jgi:hypothetical protein
MALDKAMILNAGGFKSRWNPTTRRYSVYKAGRKTGTIIFGKNEDIPLFRHMVLGIQKGLVTINQEMTYKTCSGLNTFILTTSGELLRSTHGESWYLDKNTSFGTTVLSLILRKGSFA